MIGLVLAGGRSSRFGSDKAMARFAGRTLLEAVVERLSGVCEHVLVSARPGTAGWALAETLGAVALADAPEDAAGPLAGIHAGLEWATARGAGPVAVAPCDAPQLPRDLHFQLAAAIGAAPVAYARTEGREHPLCSLWSPSALTPLRLAMRDGGHPPVWSFLREIGARAVHFADEPAFANINRADDLAALEAVS